MDSMDIDNLLNIPFTWDNRLNILNLVPHKVQVRFAIFCAEQVIYHIDDTQHPAHKAINAAKLFLGDKVSRKECNTAYAAAYAAADAAADAAAYAAADAAYAAAASTTAYAAAADAAYAAADAADAATNKQSSIKNDQISYLRDLILQNLPEEHKDNWLLIASI